MPGPDGTKPASFSARARTLRPTGSPSTLIHTIAERPAADQRARARAAAAAARERDGSSPGRNVTISPSAALTYAASEPSTRTTWTPALRWRRPPSAFGQGNVAP